MQDFEITDCEHLTSHWLYPDLKNLISRPWCDRPVAILYPQRLNLGRGGPHESAIGATGPGARWGKRTGHHHGTCRRCGPPDRPYGQDGLCRGTRSAVVFQKWIWQLLMPLIYHMLFPTISTFETLPTCPHQI